MNFEDFARAHGLIMRDVISNRWVATPTEDHPHKRNGRYKFLGDVGWVQNWATMDSPSIWKSDVRVPSVNHQRMKQEADRERQEANQKAATKAGWIMHQTYLAPHPYLDRKGFKDESGNVWDDHGKQLLVIPMRVDGRLVGCQLVDHQGEKKFLYGQRSKGAVFMIDAKGLPIFCEGYATGLSVRTVMKAMKVRYTIYICFSASNMKDIAGNINGGIIVADNDLGSTGEQAARSTGKPYWLSDAVGEDFNDFHIRVGLFKASQSLKRVLFASGSASA